MDVAPGAKWMAIPAFLLALAAAVLWPWLGAACALVGLGILAFYRDPDRTVPPAGIVAPADGKVSVLRTEGDRVRVGIFMNVFDVHVNRAPLPGTVTAMEHTAGAHRPAFSKESERNERLRIECVEAEFTVIMIAGAFARRIRPYVATGDTLDRGERIGHIAFGSRVDVVLPATITEGDLRVGVGDRVRAGETRIASGPEPTEFDA